MMRRHIVTAVPSILLALIVPARLAVASLPTGPAKPAGTPALAEGSGLPELPRDQRLRLEEAFHLARTLGPRIWEGFEGREAPVLLIAGEREFLLNRDGAPEGFSRSGGKPFRGKPVFVRPRQLSPALLATYPALGFETVVVGTAEQVGRSPVHWVVTVAHELFHVFQAARGLDKKVASLAIGAPDDASWHLGFPFPYDDGDVRSALHLLGYSLFRAATADDPAGASAITYDARTAAEAMDVLEVVLSARHADPRHMSYLRYQSAKEGVARYVEYRLAREAATGEYRPLEAFQAAEGANAYRNLWQSTYGDMLYQVKHLGSVSRSRLEFYNLGLGLALTLDGLGVEWREEYFEPGVWLDDLLRTAAGRAPAGCALEEGL